MTVLNMQNRTLGIMDNLPFLRSINNECIDLIAIDPPFAANETFTGKPKPPITDAELEEEKSLAQSHGVKHDEGRETRVRDIWTWDADVHPDWLSRIEDDYPPVFGVIKAVEACASENEAAYIAFMAVRLIECRRVLKDTGSIYVHCDSNANAYLRMLMDAVFGQANFRNMLVWNRTRGKGLNPTRYVRNCDHILYYSNGDRHTWNQQYEPYEDGYGDDWKRDELGAWESADLTGGRAGGPEAYLPFEDVLPPAGRAWAPPSRGKFPLEAQTKLPDDYEKLNQLQKCRALDAAGLIHWPKNGRPRYKKYLSTLKGRYVSDLITDALPVHAHAKERTGYATQKPLALYQRLIKASSNPGDVVLDIFAGCATTCVAAEQLGRQWIACDIAYRSWTMLKRRFALTGIALNDMTEATTNALHGSQPELRKARSFTLGPNELPRRDDDDPEPFHILRRVRRKRSVRSASWSGRISKEEAKALLIKEFGAKCWGCGWEAPRFPSGERDLGLLEVDHIWARNDKDTSGGSDELYNLALLHATCNRRKGNRMTLEELRLQNADDQRIHGDPRDLVHLGKAVQFASEAILQRGVQAPMTLEE